MKKNCYRRKDGRWQYSKQENGLKYYAIANTYRELLEKIKSIVPKQIKETKNINVKDSFAQYYQKFINTYIKTKNITEKQKNDWQRQYETHIIPNFKNIKTIKLTNEILQKFINSLNETRTQEIIYQRLIKVLKKAYQTGVIKKDLSSGLEKPKRKSIHKRTPLTIHEQIKLLKEAKKTNIYIFVMFSLIVGSRREETIKFNLKTDIDEKNMKIHIKGTKTENADRYVNVTKEFINFLKTNMSSNTFGFNIYYPTKVLAKIFKKLGINNCLHGLRHTCSSNLYFLGAKDKYRQQQLGHASIITTNDIYTNIKENIAPRYLRLIYGNLYPTFD